MQSGILLDQQAGYAERTMASLPEPEPKIVETPRKRRGGCGGCLLLTGCVIAGVIVGFVLLSVVGRLVPSGEGVLHRMASFVLGRSTTIDVSSAAVVERIRKLNRLETVVYSIDKIVEGQRENSVIPHFMIGDKLLLIAHGEVIAGIDLSQLQPSDVSVNGDHVSIKLPAPMVLSTRLDNARTKVYSRDTGVFVTADPNLESEVRKAAEDQIGQAAVADGILDKAKVNAQASLTAALYGLGFKAVDVR